MLNLVLVGGTPRYFLYFFLLFCLFDLFLSCFLGKVFAIQVWGNVLLRFAYLAPFLWYCISRHNGDNVLGVG
jgi:hypothetical protein